MRVASDVFDCGSGGGSAGGQLAISASGSSVSSGTVVFSNSNNVSFGMNGSTVTATASFSQSTASAVAVAAGTQTATSGTAVFANSNGVTFGMSGSSQVTASVNLTTTPAAISAGTQLGSTGTIVFANSNSISFGMSGSSQVTASFGGITMSAFTVYAGQRDSTLPLLNNTLILERVSIPAHISATAALVAMSLTGNSGSTGNLSINMGVYTMSGGTAGLASSGSRLVSWTSGSNTAVSSQYGGASGNRYRSVPFAADLKPGEYLLAYIFMTTNDGTWSVYGRDLYNASFGSFDGFEQSVFMDGVSSGSVTAFPATIAATNTNYVRFSNLRNPNAFLFGTF